MQQVVDSCCLEIRGIRKGVVVWGVVSSIDSYFLQPLNFEIKLNLQERYQNNKSLIFKNNEYMIFKKKKAILKNARDKK